MTRRTPGETRKLISTAEYESQRQLAQEVGCPDCEALIGEPCTTRWGDAMRMEHGNRITKATRFRELGRVECSFCDRARLTPAQREATPWPADEKLIWCAWHKQVAEEIEEARAMEAG